MVRRLLQGLDQVVSVLRVYGPEGTFAYALKERERKRGEGERRYWKCYRVPQSQRVARSVEPDLYTQARAPPGDEAWRVDYSYISLNVSLPFCSEKKKNEEGAFL